MASDSANGGASVQMVDMGPNPGHMATAPSEHCERSSTDERVTNILFDTQADAWLNVRIDSPFHGWTPDQISAYVGLFVKHYRLEGYRSLFERVAGLIEEPSRIQLWTEGERDAEKSGLRQAEKDALQNAGLVTFWDQPWPLKTTVLMLCVAAIVQGWSQTGINAANLSWPTELNATIANARSITASNATIEDMEFAPPNPVKGFGGGWAFAAVNAAPYFAASIGCWFSDPLSEILYGRRPAIMASAYLILIATLGSAFASTWQTLLALRVVLGLGMGCKATIVPVFAAEIAPAPSRGALIMNWQVFDALGIVLGFVANAVASLAGERYAWRWQLGSLCIPAWALLCGVVFVRWDSPRYLMKHDKRLAEKDDERRVRLTQYRARKKMGFFKRGKLHLIHFIRDFGRPSDISPYKSAAFRALSLLRGSDVLAAKELLFAHTQILIERHSDRERAPDRENAAKDISLNSEISWKAWWIRLRQVFGRDNKGYILRQTRAAICLMLSQQLCGINLLIFYSSTVFHEGQTTEPRSSAALNPLLFSFGLGLVNFLFALPAYGWIEKHGRRWLLMFSIPLLFVLMAMTAGAFLIDHDQVESLTRTVCVVLFTYLFTAVYSPGLGPVPFTYCAEIFPLEQRMVGMSVAVSVNFFFAGLLTLAVPRVAAHTGLAGLFGVFSGCNLIALVIIWRYVPEVVGQWQDGNCDKRAALGLEELFYIFRQPMAVYREYYRVIYISYILNCWKAALTRRPWPQPPDVFHVWVDSPEVRNGRARGNM